MQIASKRTLWRSWILLGVIQFIPTGVSQTSTPSTVVPTRAQQPILHPIADDILTPGTAFNIQWAPDLNFTQITIELWDKTSWGYSRDFGLPCSYWVNSFCGNIASHAPNTGSFLWNIPNPGNGFPRGEKLFWIKMYVEDFLKPEIGNTLPVLRYSKEFAFAPQPGQEITAPVESSSLASVSTEGVPATTALEPTRAGGMHTGTPPTSNSSAATQRPKKSLTPDKMGQGLAFGVSKKLFVACLLLLVLL